MPISLPILPVTRDDLKRLCALDAGDTTHDAALDAAVAAEQPVLEYALDPAVLGAAAGSGGLQATLALGVAEALAGGWLAQQARAPGATDDFHVGPLSVSGSRTDGLAQVADRLRAAGLKRLEPFARAAHRAASDAAGGSPDGSSKTPLLALVPSQGSVFDRPFGYLEESEGSEETGVRP